MVVQNELRQRKVVEWWFFGLQGLDGMVLGSPVVV